MRILVARSEQPQDEAGSTVLAALGHTPVQVATGAQALAAIREHHPDLVLLDASLPDSSGLDLLSELKARRPDLDVVMLAGPGASKLAVQALKAGADHTLEKPVEEEALRVVLAKVEEARALRAELAKLRALVEERYIPNYLFLTDPAMRQVYQQLEQVAGQERVTVLVRGETGTGKEHAARLIHTFSSRWNGPFVDLHCAAFDPLALERELFGSEEGAPGPRQNGLFEAAQGGTLFLDEVSELPLSTQAKLLKVLEEKQLRRPGQSRPPLALDVRLIAATNRDLDAEMEAGRFRADLYYRLNVFSVLMPPLRDRPLDVRALAAFFFDEACREFQKRVAPLEEPLLRALCAYHWPGNIRELKNSMERMVIQCRDGRLSLASLPVELRLPTRPSVAPLPPARAAAMAPSRGGDREALIRELERCRWNKSEVSRRLSISRPTLLKRMKEWEID